MAVPVFSRRASVSSPVPESSLGRGRRDIESWGRYPHGAHRRVLRAWWSDQVPACLANAGPASILPGGLRRSYGDSCLNFGRDLLDCTPLDRFLFADFQRGILRCEAGVTLHEILRMVVPRGWFLPVLPGTAHVTLGGAIANDIHGKNHHRQGSIGRHLRQLMLSRSDAPELLCSPNSEIELFRATIGGLGLTGVILWAEMQLKPVSSPWLLARKSVFKSLASRPPSSKI